jgi:hypothetical protein
MYKRKTKAPYEQMLRRDAIIHEAEEIEAFLKAPPKRAICQ